MNDTLQSLKVGIRRRWRQGIAGALSVIGGLWLLTEVLTRASTKVSASLDQYGAEFLAGVGTAAVIRFLFLCYEAREVSFYLPTKHVKITLKFGDLFVEDAHWLVGVNEFFDSILGDVISPKSVHGQIITNTYNGDQQSFRTDVDGGLASYTAEVVERAVGQTQRYPLGTTVALSRGPFKLFLVAFTRTDPQTHRSISNVPILWDALDQAFQKIDSVGNGAPLAMPLIGNGRASMHVPPQHLLRLIMLKIAQAAQTRDFSRHITINLADDCFEHLDLVDIKRGWSLL